MTRAMIAILMSALVGGAAWADDDPEVHHDDRGDAVVRRTDRGGDGLVNPGSRLPDLLRVVVGGWNSSSPRTNPYQGQWIDPRDTDLFRIDVVFDGLINPPGPIGLMGDGYDPFRYGPNPVYGFIEFDIDEEWTTGGEVEGERYRPLGNVARFGGSFSGGVGHNAARTWFDLDDKLSTSPFVERSGEEFHLSLCACQPFTIDRSGDSTPNTFDAGDTWILRGRLFRRSHVFADYSFAFGGSEPGQYDPIVDLRWSHSNSSNETTITLVWALTNRGSAALRGESNTQDLDGNAGNQASVEEAMDDMHFTARFGDDTGPGTPFDLIRGWGDDDHEPDEWDRYLEVDRWEVLALVGTAYAAPEDNGAYYVWTDVGPDFEFGDCDGDGRLGSGDQSVVRTTIAQADGTLIDADGVVNGQVALTRFAESFALYDLEYDGKIGPLDMGILGYQRRGDVNSDGAVDNADLQIVARLRGVTEGDIRYNPAADLDQDGDIDARDFGIENRLVRRASERAGGSITPDDVHPYRP